MYFVNNDSKISTTMNKNDVQCLATFLPDYGPLEIDNLQTFLDESKAVVSNAFNSKFKEIESDLDFNKLLLIKTIGVGSFGTVLLMRDDDSKEYYAVKAIEKKKLILTKQINHTLNEKKILSIINFPFIIHLVKFTSDNSYLYFILPFISGGDLFSLLRQLGKFDEGLSRFYGAQVVLALEYLHYIDLIYRDLKPENVLIDHTGYLKLTDFGFGKYVKTRTWTLCGTPEYLAPEILLNKGYSKAIDWWAFGVFIFEMVAGRSPFLSKDPIKIYEKIINARFICPPHPSPECKKLIKQFLQPNTSLRLGGLKNGAQDIKDHAWFRPIEWFTVLNRKMDPPYIPDEEKSPGEHFKNYKDVILQVSHTQRFVKEFEDF